MELTKLIEEIAQLRADFITKAGALFKTDVASVFEALPELEFITWTQYSPYFNDGDECTFSVHDLEYKLKGETPEDDDEDEDYFYEGRYNSLYQLVNWADDMTVPVEIKTRNVYEPNRAWNDRSPRKTETYEYRPQIRYVEEDKVDLYHHLAQLESVLQSQEGHDLMQDMFGNHVRVTVYRDRVEVTEVDHD